MAREACSRTLGGYGERSNATAIPCSRVVGRIRVAYAYIENLNLLRYVIRT
jgi:hypothetical protein